MADELDSPNINPDFDAINNYLKAHKRLIDSLPRIQDESIESGDYTKVDNAQEALNRLDLIGQEIVKKHGDKMPAQNINMPNLLAQQDPGFKMQDFTRPETQVPTTPLSEYKAEPAPALLQPQAPVVVNVGTQQETPKILQQPQDPKAKYDALTNKVKAAEAAVRGYIKGHQDLAIKNASQAAAAGGMAMPFNPKQSVDDKLQSYIDAPYSNVIRAASDIRAMHNNGDKDATSILSILEEGANAQKELEAMKRPGQPLGLTREEVMPRQPKLLAEKSKLDTMLKEAGELETPQLLAKKKEIETQLGNIEDFEKRVPAEPSPEVVPQTPLQGEPGEEEAKAGTVLGGKEAPIPATPEPPVDYELQREQPEVPQLEGVPKPEVVAPAAKKAYGGSGKKLVEDMGENYTNDERDKAQFYRRIGLELGKQPKPTFMDYLAIVFGAAPQVYQKWAHDRAAWQQGKERIGQEIFAARKTAQTLASQEARQSAREEAAHERAMERDKAAGDRLEKQLGFDREKLAESRRVQDFKLKLQYRQQNIQDAYNQMRGATAQQKILLYPLHEELTALTRKQNDLARMASSFAMPQEQYTAQASVVDAQIKEVLRKMAQVMQYDAGLGTKGPDK